MKSVLTGDRTPVFKAVVVLVLVLTLALAGLVAPPR